MRELERFLNEFELYETDEEHELIACKGGVTFYNITYRTAREFTQQANKYLQNHSQGHVRFTYNSIEECQETWKYQEIRRYKVDADTIQPTTLNWLEGYADDHFYRTLCKYCMYPRFIKRMNCGIPLKPMDYLSIVEALTDSGWEEMLDELKLNKSEILNDSLPLVRAYTFLSLVIKHEIFRL